LNPSRLKSLSVNGTCISNSKIACGVGFPLATLVYIHEEIKFAFRHQHQLHFSSKIPVTTSRADRRAQDTQPQKIAPVEHHIKA
jgi:hypothetical protein